MIEPPETGDPTLVWCDGCDWEYVYQAVEQACRGKDLHERGGAPHRCFLTTNENGIHAYYARHAKKAGA